MKSEIEMWMSCVSGCMKMPRLCRSPMLSVSMIDAPIRIGNVGRRTCSRGIFFSLVGTAQMPSSAFAVDFGYTDLFT
ncbi:hypothetical protein ACVMBZ_001492 [Bradyrhizobium liaoningense]